MVSIVYGLKINGNYIPSTNTKTYDYIRNSEYTITDEGRFAQPLDRITTSDYISAPLDNQQTYIYMNIILQIDIKEIYDGYQYICLYNGVNTNSKLISESQFEHYPGEANTSYKTYRMEFNGIPINMLETNDLVIRYGASGNKSDDWCNKNVKVSIEYVSNNDKLLLNMKYQEELLPGEEKQFTCYIPDTLYYIVETRGNLDTYLTIEGLNAGKIENDNNGTNNNAAIGFKGENSWVTIKLKCKNAEDFGTTEIQIRRQQAVLYGFNYGNLNTISDLDEPYNSLRTLYDTTKFFKDDESNPNHILSNDARGYPRLNSEIVFFSGHGGTGSVCFVNGLELYSSNLCSMENTKIVVWSTCHSSKGSGTTKSMLQASIDAGAKAGVGWPVSTLSTSAKRFTNKLFSQLVNGETLENSCISAASEVSVAFDPILKWEIGGNKETTISKEISKGSYNRFETSVKLNAFEKRYNDSDEWQVFEYNNVIRVYKTINGYPTNDFYIIRKENNKVIDIKHSGFFVDNMKILTIRAMKESINSNKEIYEESSKLIDCETHISYCMLNDFLVPVEINYCKYQDAYGCYFMKSFCRNLNNGEMVDYENII